MSCPFCKPESDRIFHRGADYLCFWDAYPVSDGHALIVTRRHVATWFEATLEEQQNLIHGIEIARQHIEGPLQRSLKVQTQSLYHHLNTSDDEQR